MTLGKALDADLKRQRHQFGTKSVSRVHATHIGTERGVWVAKNMKTGRYTVKLLGRDSKGDLTKPIAYESNIEAQHLRYLLSQWGISASEGWETF